MAYIWSQPVGSALLVLLTGFNITKVPPFCGTPADVGGVVDEVETVVVLVVVVELVVPVTGVVLVVAVVELVEVELVVVSFLQDANTIDATSKRLSPNQRVLLFILFSFFIFYLLLFW
jgi:hypothetical protein